ncbi:MAG: hypothetical protein JNJ92_03205 [Altererythrobacter sp.]|nr:hypothetical protein [Altererythrobacter sp.]
MANAKSRRRSRVVLIVLLLAVLALAALWVSPWGERLRGDAVAGSAYGARVACSCRFVAGRSMEDCRKDKLAGMGMISLSEDAETRSVTAGVPLIARETARFRNGYGCVLEERGARGD